MLYRYQITGIGATPDTPLVAETPKPLLVNDVIRVSQTGQAYYVIAVDEASSSAEVTVLEIKDVILR